MRLTIRRVIFILLFSCVIWVGLTALLFQTPLADVQVIEGEFCGNSAMSKFAERVTVIIAISVSIAISAASAIVLLAIPSLRIRKRVKTKTEDKAVSLDFDDKNDTLFY